MTEHDVLARAAKALRAAHTGEHQGSGFTRARIMTSLHGRRRGRLYRWAIGAPLASVLLVASAWAQSNGKWPAVWAAVTSVFSAAPEISEPSSADQHKPEARSNPSAPSAPAPALGEPEQPPPARAVAPQPSLAEAAPASEQEEAPRVQTPRNQPALSRTRPRRDAPAFTPSSAESSSEPARSESKARAAEPAVVPERPQDPELARFRAAHELHFQGSDPSAAIAAYDTYLREFPRGRFVPEARYNRALDYIKLGEKAKARRELRPFADGAYGEYRKREADQLLEALR